MSEPKQMSNKKLTAFTMIELLIVVAIISAATVIALPTIKDSLKSNTVSRSANILQGSFITAQALAREKGQPCGVLIERRRRTMTTGGPNEILGSNTATRITYVQVPAIYPSTPVNAYRYIQLTDRNNNCSKKYYFYVRKVDAGLLYAAASGHPMAKRLVDGAAITIQGKTSRIKSLTVEPRSLDANLVNEFDRIANPIPTCDDEVVDDPLGVIAIGPGVVIETDDVLYTSISNYGDGPAELTPNYSAHPMQISIQPIKAALAPVNLPGRAVVDLSASGSRENPIMFNSEEIQRLDRTSGTIPTTPPAATNEMGDIIIMFAPDGRVDAVYYDEWNSSSASFTMKRFAPPSSMSFLVGHSDGVMPNIDSAARYPDIIVPDASNPDPLELKTTPNFANSECFWVTIKSLSGAVDISPVSSQQSPTFMTDFFGLTASTPQRDVSKRRIDRSRRLIYSGAL